MEVYAGVMEYADHHIGRVIDAVDEFACEQLAVCST
jgi:arylsulfatase A-like enzyme